MDKWPIVNIKMQGVINSEMYKYFKEKMQIIIEKCESTKQKADILCDFLDITDYKYYYVYKVLGHLGKIEDKLGKNIKSLKVVMSKKWEKLIDGILNYTKPNIVIDFKIEYK